MATTSEQFASNMAQGGGVMAPATSQPATINLHFYGPVSSREFVVNEMIPLIERAAVLKQSRIEVKDQMLTGVPDVVFS